MKILVTNDDGVGAAQLPSLIRWCRKLGEVTVVVPKFEQSAKSHSIEIRKSFEITQVQLTGGIPVWTVDSTPADCVRFACAGLGKEFDLVISGINRGYNLGQDTMYSGTLAAATEAINQGYPAIALSTSVKYYDRAAEHLDEIFQYIEEHRLLQRHNLYNINIPVSPRGFRITRLGRASFSVEFESMDQKLYHAGGHPIRATGENPELDTDAAALGYISITPMTVDRTQMDVFRLLSGR